MSAVDLISEHAVSLIGEKRERSFSSWLNKNESLVPFYVRLVTNPHRWASLP